MSDRSVKVTIRAEVDQYRRAMAAAGDKTRELEKQIGRMQHAATRSFTGIAAATGIGTAGLGALVASCVKTAATFETTMRQIAVATGAGSDSMGVLTDLARKMGKETTYNAQQAGDAMLALAKAGMTQAEIKGGALASTLKLAASEGLDLGEAAGFMVQGLNTFGLKTRDASSVAVALAGGASATTASVQSLGQALSAVGPGAAQGGHYADATGEGGQLRPA